MFYIIYTILTGLLGFIFKKHLMLGEYGWFKELEFKMMYKYPHKEELIQRVFNFKLFYCDTCCFFWFTFILHLFVFNVLLAFLISILYYLILKYIKIS